jgi:hypothetical protein
MIGPGYVPDRDAGTVKVGESLVEETNDESSIAIATSSE